MPSTQQRHRDRAAPARCRRTSGAVKVIVQNHSRSGRWASWRGRGGLSEDRNPLLPLSISRSRPTTSASVWIDVSEVRAPVKRV